MLYPYTCLCIYNLYCRYCYETKALRLILSMSTIYSILSELKKKMLTLLLHLLELMKSWVQGWTCSFSTSIICLPACRRTGARGCLDRDTWRISQGQSAESMPACQGWDSSWANHQPHPWCVRVQAGSQTVRGPWPTVGFLKFMNASDQENPLSQGTMPMTVWSGHRAHVTWLGHLYCWLP